MTGDRSALSEIEDLADAMCCDVEPNLEDLARIRTLARQLGERAQLGDPRPLATAEARELAQRWAPVRPSRADVQRLAVWAGERLAANKARAIAGGCDKASAESLAIEALQDDLGISLADTRGLAILAGWSS